MIKFYKFNMFIIFMSFVILYTTRMTIRTKKGEERSSLVTIVKPRIRRSLTMVNS